MDITEITNLLLNSGVSIAIIGYFMYRDFKFMDSLDKTLVSLIDTVNSLKELIERDKEV